MLAVVSFSLIVRYAIWGFLLGSLLVFVLTLVKKLITLKDSPVARDFAVYTYWIVAGTAFIGLYLGFFWRGGPGRGGLSLLLFYAGLITPFALKAKANRLFGDSEQLPVPDDEGSVAQQPLRLRLANSVLSSRTLAHVALTLWLVSLFLPVFIYFDQHKVMRGDYLLSIGWLGALGFQFAWYANPLFLFSFVRLVTSRSAMIPSILALLLSFSTAFSYIGLGVGAGLYGYGWGLVVWIMALALMVAAAGAHEIRDGSRPSFNNGGWYRSFGLLVCVLSASMVGLLTVYDHRGGNSEERTRLAEVVFKRGPVCRDELTEVGQPLATLAGPIEIKYITSQPLGEAFMPGELNGMLEWGIPILRVEGRDYFFSHTGTQRWLESVPAKGDALATLELNGDLNLLHMRLLAADGRQVIDQSWRKQNYTGRYCPDYSSSRLDFEQPRLTLLKALGLPSARPTDIYSQNLKELSTKGVIISRAQAAAVVQERNLNIDCPSNVGWIKGKKAPHVVDRYSNNVFQVGQRFYYPGSAYQETALCSGAYVYFYYGNGNGSSYELNLIKRRLSDFAPMDSISIKFEDPALSKQHWRLQLDSVDENPEGYTIDVSNPNQGLSLRVKASVPREL
ncbi:hypothetical protein [Pseudomonas sp.]|uniref:hypothetical protein n=1 Tax=Pseudomonas sp. TaxID=306 RepID=UPI0026021C56|nr:hypothetical protein [Pseudomonas sp.]